MRLEQLARPFRDENRLDVAELHRHMLATYFNLRVCAGTVALLFPLALIAGGWFYADERLAALQRSMSAYYHTDLQGIFIGVLLFIGVILVLYRGYSNLEHHVLNAAGVFAWGVALFPTSAAEGAPGAADPAFTAPVLHGICAISFFLCIAYVCIWRSRDTVDYIADPAQRRRYERTYRTLGLLMIGLPVLAAVLLLVLEPTRLVFWVEFMAVWVFGIYWIVKSVEIKRSAVAEAALLPAMAVHADG